MLGVRGHVVQGPVVGVEVSAAGHVKVTIVLGLTDKEVCAMFGPVDLVN